MFDEMPRPTLKKSFRLENSGLDFGEDTLYLSKKVSCGTPTLKDMMKEYQQYEQKETNVKTVLSISELSPANPRKNDTFSPVFNTNKDKRNNFDDDDSDDSHLSEKFDELLKKAPKFDSISEIQDFGSVFQPKPNIKPESRYQSNRVTFNERHEGSDINTQNLNIFFSKQRNIDFNDITGEQMQFQGNSLLSNSALNKRRLSRTNVDTFFKSTHITDPVSASIAVQENSLPTTKYATQLKSVTAELKQATKELRRAVADKENAFADDPPQIMLKYPNMSSEETAKILQSIATIKEYHSNMATSHCLEYLVSIEKSLADESTNLDKVINPLKSAVSKATSLLGTKRFTRDDAIKMVNDLENKKTGKTDEQYKFMYNTLVNSIPFKVNSIFTNRNTPSVTITRGATVERSNTTKSDDLYAEIAQKSRQKKMINEIREITSLVPHVMFDGRNLSFIIVSDKKKLRFCVTLRIPDGYPWIKLIFIGVRADFGITDVEAREYISSYFSKLQLGPNQIKNFVNALIKKYSY